MTSIKPQEEWKKSKIQPKERRAITKENNSSLSLNGRKQMTPKDRN
jgi:hypothetical protein